MLRIRTITLCAHNVYSANHSDTPTLSKTQNTYRLNPPSARLRQALINQQVKALITVLLFMSLTPR